MKNLIIFYYFALCLFPSDGSATSIKSKTQMGAGGYDESITGEGTFIEGSHSKHTDDWSWSLLGEFSQTPFSDTNGNSVTEHSYNFEPGIDFESGVGYGVEGSYGYSTTPEENLANSGPELDFYYTKFFSSAASEKQEEDAYIPTVKFKMGAKTQQYVQIFSGSTVNQKTGVVRPTTGFNNLRQVATIGNIVISPWEFFSFDFTYTYYFYDRNVATFLNFLNSPSATRIGAGGFASSITNFSQSTIDFAVTVIPIEKWTVDLDVINSVSAADLSLGWSYQAIVTHEFSDWKVGLGGEREASPSSGNSLYGIVSVKYYF